MLRLSLIWGLQECWNLNAIHFYVLCLESVKSFDLQWHVLSVKGDDILISYHDVGMAFGLSNNGNFFRPIILL